MNVRSPLGAYLRCAQCQTLTRIDLLDDKLTDGKPQPHCANCYGPGWSPLMASWVQVADPAQHKEG